MRSADHPHETDRLAYLRRMNILDTSREQLYDDFVYLAATICEVPIAALSFVDGDRQWFKSSVGLEVQETSREVSFCSHAILRAEPLIVSDATTDPRFFDNELVSGEFHLRLYAGVPVTVEGYPLGSLCVIDREVKQLSDGQVTALVALARQLSVCLEARLAGERQKALMERLQRSEAIIEHARNRFEDLFENIAVACYTTDVDGVVFEFNNQAEALFGFASHEVVGRVDSELLFEPPDAEEVLRLRNEVFEGGLVRGIEHKIRTKGGATVWTVFSAQPVTNPAGEVTGAINVFHDIADRKRMESQLANVNTALKQLASTDELTQIPNRRWILHHLQEKFADSAGGAVSVILLDIDRFKEYNDTYGHPAGDEILRRAGALISTCCRSTDRAGRYGGEEFIVVLPGTRIADAVALAERIRAAFEGGEWPDRPVTASFGVATSTPEMANVDALVSLADVRLYSAKRQGRNCVVPSGSEDAESVPDDSEAANDENVA